MPHLAYRHGRDIKKYKLTVSAPLMDSVSLFFLLYSCRSHLPGFRGEHIKMPYAKVSDRSADTPTETWNGLGVWWCPRQCQCQCSVQPCCNLLVRRTCLSPATPKALKLQLQYRGMRMACINFTNLHGVNT